MPARDLLATMVRVGGENVFDQGVNYSWSAIYEVLFSILAGESRGCSSSGYYQPISASGDCMDRNSLVEIRQVENDFTRAHGPMRERDISAIISIIPCFSSKVTHLLLTLAALLKKLNILIQHIQLLEIYQRHNILSEGAARHPVSLPLDSAFAVQGIHSCTQEINEIASQFIILK